MQKSTIYNVTDFGALADGVTNGGEAFRRAARACAQTGGTIYVPAGKYLTGAIELWSNTTLYLDAGAELLFSRCPEDYPVVFSRWEGVDREVYMSCIYARNAQNVTVSGQGTLNGQGDFWWDLFERDALKYPRPHLISFHGCRRTVIENIRLINSPSWTINPICCENVCIRGVSILNPPDSPNTDGIDPDSCKNVRISDCQIDVGDDCIVLKAGTEDAQERIATENVTISGCIMIHGHGAVVMGSEMSGDIRNVVISSCVFQQTERGIRMKSRRGRGGVIENIHAENLVMEDVLCPFTATLYYRWGPRGDQELVWDKNPHPVSKSTPAIRRLRYSNITARGVRSAASFFYGLPEMPIEDVSFTNVSVALASGVDPEKADLLENDIHPIPGLDVAPGRGFYFNQVKNLSLNHVSVYNHREEGFHLENGSDIELSCCKAQSERSQGPQTVKIHID